MSKKQDAIYFDNFIECAGFASKAALMLKDIFRSFDPARMPQWMDQIHDIEHAADKCRHGMTDKLAKAFITPIEREDISALSTNIDTLTDKIEEVCMRVYIHNIQSIRPDALEMAQKVIQCCEEVKLLVKELADFKHSKTLHDHVVRINDLEEQGDRLFLASMRKLHQNCTDPIEVIAWREVYHYLESCMDACEHVADTVERVVMNNT